VEQHLFGWSPPQRWQLAPLAPILIALILISAAIGHHIFWLWIPLVLVAVRMSWWRRRRSWTGRRLGPDGWI
jgi:uncharacterized membrane protein YbhN (UPF0104 family)